MIAISTIPAVLLVGNDTLGRGVFEVLGDCQKIISAPGPRDHELRAALPGRERRRCRLPHPGAHMRSGATPPRPPHRPATALRPGGNTLSPSVATCPAPAARSRPRAGYEADRATSSPARGPRDQQRHRHHPSIRTRENPPPPRPLRRVNIDNASSEQVVHRRSDLRWPDSVMTRSIRGHERP